jgi:hypothetical protein
VAGDASAIARVDYTTFDELMAEVEYLRSALSAGEQHTVPSLGSDRSPPFGIKQ